ncbi:MAG: o-succinylbenzoate synthase [Cyclobacteriaceae bacterium]|nr:o-succinylbenzoate synthase [Cyclobacteriaceae bacterium]MCH8515603.1 o-succinylbenzoate synthase [Cyclobacteriaceae bacterium]
MRTIHYKKHLLSFSFPAGTSRGIMYHKPTWFVFTRDENGIQSIGECSPLPGLSPEYQDDDQYEMLLAHWVKEFQMHLDGDLKELKKQNSRDTLFLQLDMPSSISFGLECLLDHELNSHSTQIGYSGSFQQGKEIPINGLIWMNDRDHMWRQMQEKIEAGFRCIKMKIGAIDFDEELRLLKDLRSNFGHEITLRVDANGAFSPKDALIKLDRLSTVDLHSIEQPIATKQWDEMAYLVSRTPIPIALDEELIGLDEQYKLSCLDQIKPHYIILKPSLCGGIGASKRWIHYAESRGIDWWITSALESNVGLYGICELTSQYKNDLPQGLGTGQLYTNNIPSPLKVENGFIRYQSAQNWKFDAILDE